VAGLVTWPALPHAADSLRDPGDPALFIWTLHWLAYAAFHDPAHLYAGPIFHGFPNPTTYTDTSLLPGILLAPAWLSDERVLFFNLLMWVTLALIGFTAYLLIRDLSGSEIGGVIGGLVCGVNSYTLAHLSHLNLLSAYWVPLALLALRRLFHPGPKGPSRWAALALGVTIIGQTLSTFYVLAYLLMAVVLYLGWQALVRRAVWRWPGAWRRRLAVQLLLAGLAAGATIVLVTAPYWETQRVMGFARTREENLTWSAQPLDYLSVSLHNRTYARLLPHDEAEPLFAGFAALLLAAGGVLGAIRHRRPDPAPTEGSAPTDGATSPDREAGFYALLGLIGVVLTLGPVLAVGDLQIPMPYALLAQVPGASALRAPVRAMVLVNLSLGVFAGLGARGFFAAVAYLTPLPPFPRREGGRVLPSSRRRGAGGEVAGRALRGLLLVSVGAVILIEQQVAPLALTPLPASAATIPAVYQWLAAHPDGGVLAEFPVGVGLRDPTVESTHMYYQTWHGHPLLGGYSGFRPPTYVEIFSALDADYSTFNAEQLGILQSLDVRYLLYHEANYKRAAWTQIQAALQKFPQVHEVGAFDSGTFGADHLYALDPRPAGVTLQVAVRPAAPAEDAGTVAVQITNPYPYPLLIRLRPTLDLALGDGRRLAVPTPLTQPPGTATFTATLAGPPLDEATPWTPLAPAVGYMAIGAFAPGAR
jgi:hypothetical protein